MSKVTKYTENDSHKENEQEHPVLMFLVGPLCFSLFSTNFLVAIISIPISFFIYKFISICWIDWIFAVGFTVWMITLFAIGRFHLCSWTDLYHLCYPANLKYVKINKFSYGVILGFLPAVIYSEGAMYSLFILLIFLIWTWVSYCGTWEHKIIVRIMENIKLSGINYVFIDTNIFAYTIDYSKFVYRFIACAHNEDDFKIILLESQMNSLKEKNEDYLYLIRDFQKKNSICIWPESENIDFKKIIEKICDLEPSNKFLFIMDGPDQIIRLEAITKLYHIDNRVTLLDYDEFIEKFSK